MEGQYIQIGSVMGRIMRIFKNVEIKIVLGIMAIILIAFSAVALEFIQNYTKTLNTMQLRQNIAVMGSVVKEYPEAEAEIVKNFTQEFQGDYEFGKSLLKKYSYDENLSIEKNVMMSGKLRDLTLEFQILILILSVILIATLIWGFRQIYMKIRRIGENAEAAVEGCYEALEGDREEGDIGFLIYQINSMTERLSENVQALKNEKLFLKRIITDISHQLKTPLASLIMFNEILKQDETVSEQERQSFINESKNQLDRMEWLIKNMLKMAKLEAGVVDFHREDALISHTLHKSIAGLKHMAEEKHIQLIFSGCENVMVKHDISWTAEAFSNIIKNCIEHSREGENIEICCDENNVFVQVEIKDKGAGIPKEELPKIFNRFYKGPDSCNPTNIGIGLYITKTIIEGQSGAIYAYSEKGKGTSFVVRLMKII